MIGSKLLNTVDFLDQNYQIKMIFLVAYTTIFSSQRLGTSQHEVVVLLVHPHQAGKAVLDVHEMETVQNQNIYSMCYGEVFYANQPCFGTLNTLQQFGPTSIFE